MKPSIFCAFILAAVCATPAQAGFTISCKHAISQGKEIKTPAEWQWNGIELRVTKMLATGKLDISTVKPQRFEKLVSTIADIKTTRYVFVLDKLANGIVKSRTLAFSEGPQFRWTEDTLGFVTPLGGIVSSFEEERVYGCSMREE
ncbi:MULTISPECIES: hypothetical protein [Achromobacter]|uniref:Uncharacterized protein n=1 Tax=Achromobacter xylosoxidans (strain A8) TaxID=762376 RepID=E3HYG8_ACHXA|nr:hypothetical protein [Achromobacter xylosoxidans]ADP20122.1 hypothetical protein AXYL_06840 [Achromobacter xylosoxidans A8]